MACKSARQGRGRHLVRGESGESLVSFALTLPVMLGFILGLMQMCLAYYTYEMISECAREGTRYAIVHGTTCQTSAGLSCKATSTDVQTYISSDIGFPNLSGGTMMPTVNYPGTGASCSGGVGSEAPGCPVRVTITYSFPYIAPFMTSATLSLTSTSQMTILQ